MASRSREGDKPTAGDVPRDLANVPPPTSPMLDHSFTLQAMMEVKGAVGELSAKVDRLISDVEKQGTKVDQIRTRFAWVAGVAAAVGALFAMLIAVAGIASRFFPAS